MSGHTSDHARHTCHSLQEYASIQPLVLCHLILVEAGPQIEESSEKSNRIESELIPQVLGFYMSLLDPGNRIKVIYWVLLSI